MTNNDNPSTPETGAIQTGPDGIQRRTIIAGAAWTIPVVATAVGAPLAAASPAPTLTFTNGPYAVAACGTLKDVVIQATTDGTTPAPAGTLVTVTLPSGLTWSDGTTGPRVLPTDANGQVVLSGVKATSATATLSIAATTGTSTAAAPVTVMASTSGAAFIKDGAGTRTYAAVPPGSAPVGANSFLAPNGDLYLGNTLVATGVTSAVGDWPGAGNVENVAYVSNGGAFILDGTVTRQYASVPAGSASVGANSFLAPNGDLYQGNTLVATGVTSAVGDFPGNGNVENVAYVSNGSAFILDGTVTRQYASVPAGSVSVGANSFLAPNGDLYQGNTLVATGVTSAVGNFPGNGNVENVSYVSNGTAFILDGTVTRQYASVPAGSVSVGANSFLAPNGDLYQGNTLIATGVSGAVGNWAGSVNNEILSYVSAGTC